MFETFTVTARRSVFFARYQASLSASTQIDSDHLLLGILQADPPLASRLIGPPEKIESIRAQIAKLRPVQEKTVPTSMDLPLTPEARRILEYAAEEAERIHHNHIGPEHLLLGMSRLESCGAAKILREAGITAAGLKREAIRSDVSAAAPGERPAAPPGEGLRDLTQLATDGALDPLIGREREMERILQILSRRTRKNPALIGETGVGRTAIVEGLAQRIADGDVPLGLAERRVLSIDASYLTVPRRRARSPEIPPHAILCVEGLFDLAAAATHFVEPRLAHGELQCIATGTPAGLERTLEQAGTLARHFDVVEVPTTTEPEAIRILTGLKERYEKFHRVTISDAAIEAAVFLSRRFLARRQLPDRAIDLMDEAGARARLRGTDNQTLTREDIVATIAQRAGASIEAVRRALGEPGAAAGG